MKSTISSKGQITAGVHPVDRLFGRLKLQKSVDALVDEMRGPRPAVSRVPRQLGSAKKG